MLKPLLFDLEGDGLTPTKIHVFSYLTSDGVKSTNNYDEIRDILLNAPALIGHNISQWDIPVLERLLDIKIECEIIDTLALSWYLFPRYVGKGAHGLEAWGERLGHPKPVIDDWYNLSYEEYRHRCEEDVEINFKLWKLEWRKLFDLYGDEKRCWSMIKYLSFKMHCIAIQQKNGWTLDINFVHESLDKLRQKREEKFDILRTVLPPIPVYKTKEKPKQLYNKDGKMSKRGESWFALLRDNGLPESHEEPVSYQDGYTPCNPGSTQQIKDWLFSLGWEPRTFDYKKNKEGVERAIPQIKQKDSPELCESILELAEEHKEVYQLNELSVLKHRIPFLENLLGEVDEFKKVHARCGGFTNTLRLKHKELVNLPKLEKLYGFEVRGALTASEGRELFGSDLVSLEDRIKQHFMYKFDPDFVDEMNIEGYDPHLKLALLAGAVTPEQVNAYTSKEDTVTIKPIRSIYKNGNYACQYGAFPPKIAQTTKTDLETAQKIFNAYWKVNRSIKLVADEQEIKSLDGELWLKNPINGFYYSLRKKKDIFSTLVQGTASYIFDLWLRYIVQHCPYLIGQFHDEFILDVPIGYQAGVTKFIQEAINKVNEQLQLNRQLDIDIQFGQRYSEIH